MHVTKCICEKTHKMNIHFSKKNFGSVVELCNDFCNKETSEEFVKCRKLEKLLRRNYRFLWVEEAITESEI